MSDKQFLENLISGLLDNQLSPAERAEAEKLLADHPELRQLKEELVAQSEMVAQLPRFSLGDDFASQLLADDRVDQAFQDISDVKVSGANVAAYENSSRFGMAFSAIAALAALVLITLFIKPMPQERIESAKLESSDSIFQSESEDDKAGSVLGEVASKKDSSTKSRIQPRDQGDERSLTQIQAPIVGREELDTELADNLTPSNKRGDFKSRNQIALARRIDQPNKILPDAGNDAPKIMMLKEDDSKMEREQAKSGIRGKAESLEKKTQSEEKLDSSLPFADAVQDTARAAKEAMSESTVDLDAARNAKLANDVEKVIQVVFENGTEAKMIEELGRCFGQNSIVLNDAVQQKNGFSLESGIVRNTKEALRGGGGGGFGGGGGRRDNTKEGQPVDRWESTRNYLSENLQREQSENSLSLFVTTTPGQLKSLLSDLRSEAKVQTIEIPELPVDYFLPPTGSVTTRVEETENDVDRLAERKKSIRARAKSSEANLPGEALSGQVLGRGVALKNSEDAFQQKKQSKDVEMRFSAAPQGGANAGRRPKALDSRELPRNYLLLVRGPISETGETTSESARQANPKPSKK